MKKALTIAVVGLLQSITVMQAQKKAPAGTGPYEVKRSVEFVSPKGHKVLNPLGYGKDGIIQVNAKGVESFSFQKFSKDLKLEKENVVKTEGRIGDYNYFERIITTKNKSYLFTREVKKDAKTEGIAALEFIPSKLDFAAKSVPLFQSSDKIKAAARKPGTVAIQGFSIGGIVTYDFVLSEDKTKFLYDYVLTPKEKKDKINKDIIGMYVFDENLNKLWGGEYKMPYTEAIMDNLGYILADDGKVYLLAKVFENDDRKAKTKDGKAGYHFEVLVYDNDKKALPIEIKLDTYFPQDAFMFEDINHNIVISGFYSKKPGVLDDGVYMVKLDVAKATVSKINGGFYEIPSDIIKAFSSAREKKKMEKKESKDGDIGIRYLRMRDVYTTPNGSTKIVAEQYEEKMTSNFVSSSSNGLTPPSLGAAMGVASMMTNSKVSYETYAEDIFVMSIDPAGKMEWIKKIPKKQHSADWMAVSMSTNDLIVGNDVHLFYLDNIKNWNLPESQAPKIHQDRKGGFLNGVMVDAKGTVSKYNLGDTKTFKTNFFIRYFVKGNSNNLISTERKKKKNILFSIEVK